MPFAASELSEPERACIPAAVSASHDGSGRRLWTVDVHVAVADVLADAASVLFQIKVKLHTKKIH